MEEIKVPMCNTPAMCRKTVGAAGGRKWRSSHTLERLGAGKSCKGPARATRLSRFLRTTFSKRTLAS